jgi:hypothetical protein
MACAIVSHLSECEQVNCKCILQVRLERSQSSGHVKAFSSDGFTYDKVAFAKQREIDKPLQWHINVDPCGATS